ncbi:Glutathione hydrolase 2 [Sesamum alatum]|uniref:Glutathione hydrolase n=1 Tax=Sesamum alatum TaxID=300844 RepID=A0AAE1YVL5_9LAMI|nr:Glutathione hydrolase 2 [Sesamum alatum]
MFLLPVCPVSGHGLAVFVLSLLSSALFLNSSSAARGERVKANNGVVATDETECSKIGRDMLRLGGHAVDAAVASTLCIGVLRPADSGLGGGGFILVRSHKGEAKVFDMREMAPARATKDMFSKMNATEWKHSPLAIAVPGQLAGLYTAHQQYGKLSWRSLVKPAENLARKGFNVSRSLFQKMARARSMIMADKAVQTIFAPNGTLLIEGQTLRLKKLADTLAAIAKDGMSIFYNGSIAQGLADDITRVGGIVTKEDLQKYRVIVREPLVAHVLGCKMVIPPPASGGAVVILILKTLSMYNMTGVPTSLLVHRTVEALKYALALRMSLGDPGFVDVSTTLKSMISNSTAEKLRKLIDDNKTFDPPHCGSKWSQLNDHGTSHICVVDRQRNVVTMMTSINTHFGSRFMSPSTGIFLNNQMHDFSIPTSKVRPSAPANYVTPFKRPLSSMAPAILEKGGRVKAVVGSAGGLLIPDAVSQVLVNFFVLKKPSYNAVKAPRFYHRLYPNELLHENYSSSVGDRYAFSVGTLNELKRKGHKLKRAASVMSVCQFVVQVLKGKNSGQLIAVSDPRKGGFPAGY